MIELKGANCTKVALSVDGTRHIRVQGDVRLHLLHVCVWCAVIAHRKLARKVAQAVD
jgi:hypothetical protein